MKENKNILIAVLLSLAVLAGFEILMPPPKRDIPVQAEATSAPEQIAEAALQKPSEPVEAVEEKIEETPQIPSVSFQIKNAHVSGSISSAGGKIERLVLSDYKETIEKNSPAVEWLSPTFYAAFSLSGEEIETPALNAVWQADSDSLTPEKPLTLTWKNRQGILFKRTIALDDGYMFTITDSVQNTTDKVVSLSAEASLIRHNPPEITAGTVHEGFVGFLDNSLQEKKYNALKDEQKLDFLTQKGWLGQTDKYWLATLIFDQKTKDVAASFRQKKDSEESIYTSSFRTPVQKVAPGETFTNTTRLFAGPKVLKLIEHYQKDLNIEKFELAIDFGWYYFLTKPFLQILSFLKNLVGNMGIAILIFATILRLLMLPIAGKSFESTAKMKKIQPQMKRLQEMYKNDKMRLNQEMMLLYRKEKVNPAAGCLPMMIQIPVFFSLYKVLSVSIEMRQAPFFGWIHDLSMPDPSSVFSLFGYAPWPVPSLLDIGVWPVLMGITMVLQQRMTPAPNGNKDQAAVLKWMPIIFTFMLGRFASGLVIYWAWSNLLSILQQHHIMKKYGK